MHLQQLIDGLSQPEAYKEPVESVTVCHTHISVVFLVGEHVYKIKKPVNFGFLDFSTLEKRKHFCEEEVRLNRRLAADVYEGVVPVTQTNGNLQWGGTGEVVEWGVKMRRLPDEARLIAHLKRRTITEDHLAELARVLAEFHRQAATDPAAGKYGHSSTVTQNARENFTQATKQIGLTLSETVYQRLQELTEAALNQQQALIEARAERGMTRETHGDLHLNHVYFFPEAAPPPSPPFKGGEQEGVRWIIIDCIEFNERFRFADPLADLAFLLMDLQFHGFRQQADQLTEAYMQACGDREGLALLPFYIAYRAAVRGKVEGFELMEKEIPVEEKAVALARSRAHWLLAYRTLAPAQEVPGLIMIGGLPGTGKTTLALALAQELNLQVIRSDVVRKALAGIPANDSASTSFGQGLYSEEMTARTYAECLRRAEEILFQGGRVIVDANFRKEAHRQLFLAAFERWALEPVILWCEAPAETIQQRLFHRRDDASDADWNIYQQAQATMEPFSPAMNQWVVRLASEGSVGKMVDQALQLINIRGRAPSW